VSISSSLLRDKRPIGTCHPGLFSLRMFESLCLEFRTGQIIEVALKPGLRWVFEGAAKTQPPGRLPGDPSMTIGDPDGIRGLQQLSVYVARLCRTRGVVWVAETV